jgi:hypothetical protein
MPRNLNEIVRSWIRLHARFRSRNISGEGGSTEILNGNVLFCSLDVQYLSVIQKHENHVSFWYKKAHGFGVHESCKILNVQQMSTCPRSEDFDHWSQRFCGLGILIGVTTDIYLHIRDFYITVHVNKRMYNGRNQIENICIIMAFQIYCSVLTFSYWIRQFYFIWPSVVYIVHKLCQMLKSYRSEFVFLGRYIFTNWQRAGAMGLLYSVSIFSTKYKYKIRH